MNATVHPQGWLSRVCPAGSCAVLSLLVLCFGRQATAQPPVEAPPATAPVAAAYADSLAQLEEIHRRIFEISTELSRTEDAEHAMVLRAELRRLVDEARRVERTLRPRAPRDARVPFPPGGPGEGVEGQVDWEQLNEQLNRGLEGIGGTLSQLGELLEDAEVQLDGETFQFQDRSGSRVKIRVPDEMKENLAEGFKELQRVWGSEASRESIQTEIRRLQESVGEGHGFAFRDIFAERDRRTKTVQSGSIIRFGEDVEIAEELILDGDVFVVGADAYVVGEVRGDVVAIMGNIFVEDEGRVENAVAAGGQITLDDRDAVHGNMFDLGELIPSFLVGSRGGFGVLAYGIWLAMLGMLLFFGFAVAGQRVDRMAEYTRAHTGRALLSGSIWFAVALGGFVVAALGLVLTVIGIPVALVLTLAFVVILLLSYFTSCEVLGTRLLRWAGSTRPGAAWGAALLGLTLLELPGILATLLRPVDALSETNVALRALDVTVKFIAVALGFGALLATRGGLRNHVELSSEQLVSSQT